VPPIVLGTANLGSVAPDVLVSAASRGRSLRYLDGMLEAGCSALDLAASYQLGGTERIVGAWMESRRNRDRLFLITKGGHPYPFVQPNRLTARALTEDLHASLRRLKTDHVDLYLLHRDHPGSALEPIIETMLRLHQRGLFKAWGVSNWTHDRIRALDPLARAAGLPLAASSPQFSLVDWTAPPWKGCVTIAGDANREARAFHASTQLPVLAWSPLASGFLSSGGPAASSDRAYGTTGNLARKERAGRLGEKYDVPPAQIALAYLFSQPFPVFAVVATSTPARMKANLAAAALRLAKNEVRWLESGGGQEPDLPPRT